MIIYCCRDKSTHGFCFPTAPDLQGATPPTVQSESSEEEDDRLPRESQPLLAGKTVTITGPAPTVTIANQEDDEGDFEGVGTETGRDRDSSDSERERGSDNEDEDDDEVSVLWRCVCP